MPLNDGIDFYYKTDVVGQYNFDPRPLFTVGKEFIKTPANTGIATKYTLTLEGHILPTGLDLDDHKGSMHKVFRSGDLFRQAFNEDFGLLYLKCDTETDPIISGYPKVISLDMRNAADNYVRRLDYTLILELPTLVGTTYDAMGLSATSCGNNGTFEFESHGLLSYTDEWSVEFLDERVGSVTEVFGDLYPSVFTVTRNISAQGNSLGCSSGGDDYIEPWKRAHLFIQDQLSSTPDTHIQQLTGLLCLSGVGFANEMRNISVNTPEGSVTATQTWVASSGDLIIEELEISIEKATDSNISTITVGGSIQGMAIVSYGSNSSGCPPDELSSTKFQTASGVWSSISGNALSRAQAAYKSFLGTGAYSTARDINTVPISQSVGYNTTAGSINYTFAYDDRCTVYNPNALVETINYTWNDPADVFASLIILGRSKGPLMQSIGTVGPTTAELQIDAIFLGECITGAYSLAAPTTVIEPYNDLVNGLRAEFTGAGYDVLYSNGASKSYDAHAGHFTYSQSWTLGKC